MTVPMRNLVTYFSGWPVAGGFSKAFYYASVNFQSGGSVFVEGRLRIAGVIARHLFGAARIRGEQAIGTAALILDNTDGGADTLADYVFDGNNAVLFDVDPPSVPVATNAYVSLYLEQPLLDEDAVTFACRDRRYYLDNTPCAIYRYAGTNSGSPLAGIEGTAADIKNTRKPVVIGKVFNITPKLVNTTRLIYQVTSRLRTAYFTAGGFETGYTITVYDKRSALTRGSDYTSQSDMETTAPSAGQYRVWPAGGCFRVGSTPVGQITCDVTNPGASSSLALSQALKDVIYMCAGVTPPAYLVADPDVGVYITGEESMLEVFAQLAASVGAYVRHGPVPTGTTLGNTFWCGQLTLPASLPFTPGVGTLSLDESSILPGTVRQVQLQDEERGKPVWRVNLRYKRNYTVMGDADLAGVAAADAAFCKQEWRVVTVEDATVRNGAEITVDTCLVDDTAATTEANRLLTLLKTKRDCFELQVAGQAVRAQLPAGGGALFQVGLPVHITYPRFTMAAGKDFILIGDQENLEQDVHTLTVWG